MKPKPSAFVPFVVLAALVVVGASAANAGADGAQSPSPRGVVADGRLLDAYASPNDADKKMGAGFFSTALTLAGKQAQACTALSAPAIAESPVVQAARERRRVVCAADVLNANGGEGRQRVIAAAGQAAFADNSVLQWQTVSLAQAHGHRDIARAVALAYLGRVEREPSRLDGQEQTAREAAAQTIAALRDDKSLAKRVDRVLYAHLGETGPATAALPAMSNALQRHTDQALAMTRSRVLQTRHDNPGVFATLSPHEPAEKDLSTSACEIRLMLGKAARKTRKYKTANRYLKTVSTLCGEPWKKKSRYLLARVATFSGQKDALSILDSFIASYPDDGLTDDVLLWKAEWHVSRGPASAAEATYRQIIERFPKGDMVGIARFDVGFLLARQNKRAAALTAFDEAARQSAGGSPILNDQALYWRARLKLMPDVESLALNTDKPERDAGFKELLALAKARSVSFYGDMARQVTFAAAQSLGREDAWRASTKDTTRVVRHTKPHGFALAPSTLDDDPRAQTAAALMAAGYGAEAEILLDAIDRKTLGEKSRFTLAAMYFVLGRKDRSHQVVRFAKKAGGAILPGRPTAKTVRIWELAYPRAHAEALTAGADAVALPPELLMGLSREESAFEASVVSWAGAVGLCQLMPFTADEEAKILKLEKPTREALFTPAYNARLGGSHLARRLKLLEHPLLAIAAYNAGPGNVRKWRRKGPLPIDAFVESIPVAQTRGYVKKVTGSWVTYSWLDRGAQIRYPLELPAVKRKK